MDSRETGIIHKPARTDKMSPRQAAAIDREKSLAAEISTQSGEEVLRMFLQIEEPNSYLDIARVVIPDTAEENPVIASHAVRFSVYSLISESERKAATHKRLGSFARRTLSNLTPEQFRERQSNAARTGNRKSPRNTRSIVEGRGLTRWSDIEDELLEALANSPSFKHQVQNPRWGEKPNYGKIADILNQVFHQGNSVRTPESVRVQIRKPKGKPRQPRV